MKLLKEHWPVERMREDKNSDIKQFPSGGKTACWLVLERFCTLFSLNQI